MNWIRIATGIMRDPTLVALSEALGVNVPCTTGHVVGVLTSLPEGAKTGDLSAVSDRTLEQWAMWKGKRGKFAAAFRTHLCDTQGVVRSWEKHNGAAIRRAGESAERAKTWREERKTNAKRTRSDRVANAQRTSLRDETRRNEELTTPLRAVVSSGGAAPDTLLALSFADPSHQRAADGYQRAHPYPAAMVATLEAMTNGMQGPAVAWPVIGAALVEMQGAGARFSPATLRAFVRRLQETPAGKPLTWDDLMTPAEGVRDVA